MGYSPQVMEEKYAPTLKWGKGAHISEPHLWISIKEADFLKFIHGSRGLFWCKNKFSIIFFEFVYFKNGTSYNKTNSKRFKCIHLDTSKFVHIGGILKHSFNSGSITMQLCICPDPSVLILTQLPI
jgi:hypothetical protein